MGKTIRATGLAMAAGLLATGCAYHGYNDEYYGDRDGYYDRDYYGGNGYRGNGDYGRRSPSDFRFHSREDLDPWLNDTEWGRRFVRDNFRVRRNEMSRREAIRANIAFRRWADTDHDYRLTDDEIRTALVHIADDYGGYHY